MANIRQYIGARYVFKIYENSADPSSAEWESGVTYEPLTIVTYLNSTYASKKEVPGSVGNPASNPSYWVVTGAYNGQIAHLQQQIDALQSLTNELSNMNNLNNKNIHIIGDSISDPTILANNWAVQFKTKAEACGATVSIDGVNGSSITADLGNPGLTSRFLSSGTNADIIIIELGVNDWILNHDFVDIAAEMSSFMQTINGLTTPPLVYWIMPLKNKDPRTSLHPLWLDAYRSYYAYFASSNGIRIIDGANCPVINTMTADNIAKYYLNDTYNLHPNELGSKYVCDYVFDKCLSGGDNSICDFVTNVSLTDYVSSGVTLGQSLLKFTSNGTCNFMLNGYTTPSTQETKILDSLIPLKYMTNYPTVPVTAYDNNGASVPAYIALKSDGCVYLDVPASYVNHTVTFFACFSVNNSAVYDNYG